MYFVTYQPSLQVGRVVCTVNTVRTNDSSVVIGDLDPTTKYTVAVDFGTTGGKLRSTLASSRSVHATSVIGPIYMHVASSSSTRGPMPFQLPTFFFAIFIAIYLVMVAASYNY